MDRDVYLILIGAGISLATSVVTLLLQFLLNQWNERMRTQREQKQQQSREIRAALLDKRPPTQTKSLVNSILRRILELDPSDLDIPPFLRRRSEQSASPENSRPPTPTEKFWAQYIMPITIGILVFIGWVVYIWISKTSGNPL